ncbi:MAG TPA: serine protease [Solirubrobacterales bacterium]|nr:serine protease [Solirubrobacterales bacterium]
MSRAMGSGARRVLATATTFLALLVASAQAAPPAVHELKAAPRAAAAPLRVPGRAPAPRFRRGPEAKASSLRVLNSSEDGTRTNGRIFGVDPAAGAYSCSGTAINTPSRSIVLTAGHCVIEDGSEGQRISFVPAYDHGTRPFGTFTAESVYVMPQWRHGENPDYDVAALRVQPNSLGALTDVVGARGYSTSRSRLGAFQIFGYPAARAGGEELRSCRAHGLGLDRLTDGFPGPPTMPASCDMAAGSSGGAWLLEGQLVDGVTSYSYQGRPTQLFSPYFGPEVASFLAQLP